jgi:PAS domain S-box-containing protein
MAQNDQFARDATALGGPVLDGVLTDATSPLNAIDLPIILISRDCKITSLNRPASTVLGLTAADLGTSIGNTLPEVKDLDKICARVIADGAPHRIEIQNGDRWFLVRIAPCCGSDRQVSGAALSFTNVTAFRASIDQAIYEREYTKAILNTVVDPLVVLDTNFQIQTANRAFYELFGLSRNETNGVSIRKLGNRDWQNPEHWKSIEAVLSGDTQLHTVEIDCEFPSIGGRTIALNASRLTREGNALLLLTLQDVTERKRADRANSHLAAIVGSSDDAIISKQLDGTITSWNDSAQRLFGYSAEEAIGQHITLIVPWERRSEEEEILRRLARGERVDHFETVRRRKDGNTLDVSLTISPIRDADGKVIGASKVARDVTEKNRTERALRESEKRLRTQLTEDADALAKLNELNLRLWRCRSLEEGLNEMLAAVIELLGAEKGNIQLLDRQRNVLKIVVQRGFQQDFLDFFREVSTKEDSACGRALRLGQRVVIEDVEQDLAFAPMLSVARAAGYRSVVSEPLISAGGEPLGMVSTHFRSPHRPTDQQLRRLDLYARQAADYIVRCKTDEALQQSEERLRLATEAAKIGTFDWNIQTGVNTWTPELEAMYGLVPGEFGKSQSAWEQLVHPDDRAIAIAKVAESLETGNPIEHEWRIVWPDGSVRWILGRFQGFKDASGKPFRLAGINIDITARRQAEENYRQLVENLDAQVHARTRELEERNAEILRQAEHVQELSRSLLRAQDEERRHIARELHDSAGQTLAVLGMSIGSLAQNANRPKQELQQTLDEANELVQQLTKDIRTASYLLHPPLLDENGLPAALSWYISGLADRSGLSISFNISKEFGRLPNEMELAIFRLIQECLTNIHRHSGSKSAAIHVLREDDRVLVEIRDQGKGIPPEKLAEIQTRGSGVGIRGMRERLREFQGELIIDSSGVGTTVLVSLPMSQKQQKLSHRARTADSTS